MVVVVKVGPSNERGGGVFILVVIVVRIRYWAVLPGEFVWRGGGRSVIVLDKQLARRRHRAKRIIVRGERVKVEGKFRSADAV